MSGGPSRLPAQSHRVITSTTITVMRLPNDKPPPVGATGKDRSARQMKRIRSADRPQKHLAEVDLLAAWMTPQVGLFLSVIALLWMSLR